MSLVFSLDHLLVSSWGEFEILVPSNPLFLLLQLANAFLGTMASVKVFFGLFCTMLLLYIRALPQ